MTDKSEQSTSILLFLVLLIPVFICGIIGGVVGFSNNQSNHTSGFLWGIGIGLVIVGALFACTFGWDWIKKKAEEGRLFPYMLGGLLVAIMISAYLAYNLGNPSCEESSDEPNGTCLTYSDDGFEATTEQQWRKFWSTLPTFTVISLLIAYIVQGASHKEKKT